MFRITNKCLMGLIGFLFFYYSGCSYSVEPAEAVKIGVIDQGGAEYPSFNSERKRSKRAIDKQ